MTTAALTVEGEVSWNEAVGRVHREGNIKSCALEFDKKNRLLRRQTMGGSKIQTHGKARAEPKIGNGGCVLGRPWIPANEEWKDQGD